MQPPRRREEIFTTEARRTRRRAAAKRFAVTRRGARSGRPITPIVHRTEATPKSKFKCIVVTGERQIHTDKAPKYRSAFAFLGVSAVAFVFFNYRSGIRRITQRDFSVSARIAFIEVIHDFTNVESVVLPSRWRTRADFYGGARGVLSWKKRLAPSFRLLGCLRPMEKSFPELLRGIVL